ncbi:hypothetical protein ABZ356_20175 [Micromonospora zamorensis]|uniref:hypothetical protein n=1 Tax=Micromonospora zamorensis TaxID=709883 RepID=UPI0033AF277A
MHVDERAGVFWRWWTAGTTSMVGSAVGAVALPLTALTVLGNAAFPLRLVRKVRRCRRSGAPGPRR